MSVINTNVQALGAQKSLYEAERSLSTAMERLSTGKRINSAADDASGLSIATRMTSQVKGLNMAIRNANDGISLVQTTEGALSEVTDMLQRMRELAIQATNGTSNASDRAALDAEVQQLKAEIDRIATTTTFNNQAILDGSFKNKVLQIGDSADATVGVAIASAKIADLGMASGGTGGDSIVGARISLGSSSTMEAGDVEINGQALAAIASGSDIEDLINNINNNVDNVTASGFNTVVAKNAGNGVTLDNEFQIQVTPLGGSATTYYISASNNMDELVANINAEAGGVVTASINDQGKLVLSNETGATIAVNDDTTGATTNGYDGASGFFVSGTSGTFSSTLGTFTGFISLASDDGSAIRIEAGNKGLTSPGTETDLALFGFREVSTEPENEYYTTTGLALTDVSTAWGMSDVKINGVQIYDADVATTSFQGRLNAINNFTQETGVSASAYFEQTWDTTNYNWDGGAVMINGVTVSKGASLSAFATNINSATGSHGLVATVNGKNLTLTGANVQTVDIDQVDPNSVIQIQSSANAIQAASATARTLTIVTADIVVGRTLTVFARGEASATVGRTFAAHYTIQTGDSITSVAQGLATAIVNSAVNPSNANQPGAFATSASTGSALVSASGTSGVITFKASAGYGLAEMGVMVTEKALDVRMVSTGFSGGALSGAAVAVTFLTGDLVADRVLELRIFNGKDRGGQPVDDIFVRHTVTSTDTITTVAAAFVTEIEKVAAQAAFAGRPSGFSGTAAEVSSSAGVLTIALAANYGTAWGELVAIAPTLGEGGVNYGRIRLDSTNNTPIQITLGDSQTVGEHGFLEMNAGAADFEVNSPTLGAGGGSSLSGTNVLTIANANKAITALDGAIEAVNTSRSSLGALENRLSHTVDNLSNVVLNTEASRSRILDTDYAAETSQMAKQQIIQQAATAMLAQANQLPQTVLALLK